MKSLLNVTMLCVAVIGCGLEKEEPVSADLVDENDVRTLMPDFDSVLKASPSLLEAEYSHFALVEGSEDITNLIETPKRWAKIAGDQWSLAKTITYELFGKPYCRDEDETNDPADCDRYPGIVKASITEKPQSYKLPRELTVNNGPSALRFYKNVDGLYHYTFEFLWMQKDGLYQTGLALHISKQSANTAFGRLIFYPSLLEQLKAPAETIVTDFSSDGFAAKSKTFFINSQSSETSIERLVIETNQDQYGLYSAVGAAIRNSTEAIGSFSPFDGQKEFAWIFNIVADDPLNIAVEKLAFPYTEAYANPESFFGEYGLDQIFARAVVAALREHEQCGVIGVVLENSGLRPDLCVNEYLSDADVYEGLQLHCKSSAASDFCNSPLLQTGVWSNPIYLDQNGFVDKSKLSSSKSYEDLATILDSLSPYQPLRLKLQEVPEPIEAIVVTEDFPAKVKD